MKSLLKSDFFPIIKPSREWIFQTLMRRRPSPSRPSICASHQHRPLVPISLVLQRRHNLLYQTVTPPMPQPLQFVPVISNPPQPLQSMHVTSSASNSFVTSLFLSLWHVVLSLSRNFMGQTRCGICNFLLNSLF